MDRRLGAFGRVDHAGLRRHDEYAAAETGVAQPRLKVAHVAAHQRLEGRVDGGGRGAAVFAQRRVEGMRERERHARQVLFDQGADALFVRRIDDRPKQADGDRLDAASRQQLQCLDHRRLVEGRDDRAVGADPLRHLERQRAGDIGLRKGDVEVEHFMPAALAQHQDVGVALRHQQRRARRSAGDDGVDRARRAMDQHAAASQQLGARQPRRVGRRLQAVENADDGVVRCRLRLEHAQAAIVVLDHEVGEGASRVDRKPHPLPLW